MRLRLSRSVGGLRGFSAVVLTATGLVGGLTDPVSAQPDPIDFVTIGAPGNAPWPGDGTPGDIAIGRGGVDYEYRIGRYEVTTAQWVEFFNAAYDRPRNDWLPHLRPPDFWGAVPTTPNTPGGLRWRVPAGNEMIPTGNISWRMAAMYTNWLHNDQSSARAAFMDGAYDVSTFGYVGNIFTDQLAHHPDARYWIPTWDEWLKAAHYDPDRNGPGQGGWWTYSNTSNTSLIGAPPPSMGGNGQANFGFSSPNPFGIPLGAYTQTQSPWGLYDVAGATAEWTESVRTLSTGYRSRYYEGSWWDSSPGYAILDSVYWASSVFPSMSSYEFGFRIAAPVPAPATCIPALLVLCRGARYRAKEAEHGSQATGSVRDRSGRRGGGRSGTRSRSSSGARIAPRSCASTRGRTSRSTSARSPRTCWSASTTRRQARRTRPATASAG